MRQERKGSLRRVTTWSPASAAAAVPLDNTQIPSPYTQGAFSEAVSATDGGSGPQRPSQFRGLARRGVPLVLTPTAESWRGASGKLSASAGPTHHQCPSVRRARAGVEPTFCIHNRLHPSGVGVPAPGSHSRELTVPGARRPGEGFTAEASRLSEQGLDPGCYLRP